MYESVKKSKKDHWVRFDVKSDSNNNPSDKNPYYYYVENGFFDLVWPIFTGFFMVHALTIPAFYVLITERPYYTVMWMHAVGLIVGWGVTAGAHRLWSHRSYEAQWPLKLILMLGQTLSGQYCLYFWARDHRTHHKWTDTDADPHTTTRGFYFAHMGWLSKRRHPECVLKARTLDYTDLDNDKFVMFQRNHYWKLYPIFAILLPMLVPMVFWGEKFWTAFLITYPMRYFLTLHIIWSVNSAAHMFGDKKFNPKIFPTDNMWVSVVTHGEGYHNYHHQFPQDYRASELGGGVNSTTLMLNVMGAIGWAFNLKMPSQRIVEATKVRTQKYLETHNRYGDPHEDVFDGDYDMK